MFRRKNRMKFLIIVSSDSQMIKEKFFCYEKREHKKSIFTIVYNPLRQPKMDHDGFSTYFFTLNLNSQLKTTQLVLKIKMNSYL